MFQGIQNIPHRPICVTVILTSFPHVIRMNSRGTMDVVQCDSHVWRFHAQPGNGDGASAITQNGQPQQQVAVNNPGVPRGNFLAMQNYAPQQAHGANNHSGGHEGPPALVQNYGQQQPQTGALPIPSSTFFRGMDGRLNK
ncbi:unnamed protein product [Orchesella dallaii]|uniref:Uncharacterized protein n=1 Tax=Orchesella dallaii TaxID=48710 RepID=A0ABP1PVG6_9HEXA